MGMANEVEKMSVEELEVVERLRPQWIEVVQGIGGDLDNADETFGEIVRRYRTGDGRSYHNLFHIDRMLGFISKFDHLSKNKYTWKAGIFGHDLVYVPGSQTNDQ
jgi:predicted metal-dependent HD superfamily phosphohydrolase